MAADMHVRIPLRVNEQGAVRLRVSDDAPTTFSRSEYVDIHSSEYPDYVGPYEANALFSEQVFQTNESVMQDDFTVHAINYTEAPNPYGITVTIGG